MRHSIEVNEALLKKASEATGLDSERAVGEKGLRLFVKVKGQEGIRRLRGRIAFEGNVRELDKGRES